MSLPYDISRCTALKKQDAPIDPCATCARYLNLYPHAYLSTPWTIPPATWNGTRYVCEHHIEAK